MIIQDKYWWFEPFDMLRKCVLIMAMSLFPSGTSVQIICAMFVSLVFVFVYGQMRPYKSNSDDTIATSSLMELCVTFFVSASMKLSMLSQSPDYEFLFGYFLIFVACVLPLLAVVLAIFEMLNEMQGESDDHNEIPLSGANDNEGRKTQLGTGDIQTPTFDQGVSSQGGPAQRPSVVISDAIRNPMKTEP